MPIAVDWSGWALREKALACHYDYSDPQTGRFVSELEFQVKVEPGPGGLSVQQFCHCYLSPFDTGGEEIFLLLFLGKGTSIGKFLPVSVNSDRGNRSRIRFRSREDVIEIVKALYMATDLRFMLKGPSETYVELPVPNNTGFRELHDKLYRSVASSSERTGERSSLFDRLFR